MLTLYKKRTLGELISDTFLFFRTNGTHFLRHYFIINGGFLLVLLGLSYFVFKVYFEIMFSNIGGNSTNYMEHYFENNLPLVIGVVLFFIILTLFVSLLSYCYPILYFKLYIEKKGINFTTKDILIALKGNFAKISRFFVALIVFGLTIGLLFLGLCILLMISIIGIPILVIVLPAFMAWIQLSFYIYLNTSTSTVEAFRLGFEYTKNKFWPIVGSTIVMYLIVQAVTTLFSLIPYIIGVFNLFTSIENGDAPNGDTFSLFTIIMVIVMCISILISYIMNNLLVVNSGIVYYTIQEEIEGNSTLNDIDLIGSQSE
ncbi:hypothetical protein [Flavobacterium sp.]|uniref:hypothetical protein n=1 Tax=Flavobacterium sp. TaxID=239 RepID=UPI002FD97BA8